MLAAHRHSSTLRIPPNQNPIGGIVRRECVPHARRGVKGAPNLTFCSKCVDENVDVNDNSIRHCSRIGQVRSGIGTYVGAARRRVHLAHYSFVASRMSPNAWTLVLIKETRNPSGSASSLSELNAPARTSIASANITASSAKSRSMIRTVSLF